MSDIKIIPPRLIGKQKLIVKGFDFEIKLIKDKIKKLLEYEDFPREKLSALDKELKNAIRKKNIFLCKIEARKALSFWAIDKIDIDSFKRCLRNEYETLVKKEVDIKDLINKKSKVYLVKELEIKRQSNYKHLKSLESLHPAYYYYNEIKMLESKHGIVLHEIIHELLEKNYSMPEILLIIPKVFKKEC